MPAAPVDSTPSPRVRLQTLVMSVAAQSTAPDPWEVVEKVYAQIHERDMPGFFKVLLRDFYQETIKYDRNHPGQIERMSPEMAAAGQIEPRSKGRRSRLEIVQQAWQAKLKTFITITPNQPAKMIEDMTRQDAATFRDAQSKRIEALQESVEWCDAIVAAFAKAKRAKRICDLPAATQQQLMEMIL